MGCFLASAALQPMEVGVGIAALKMKEGKKELRGPSGSHERGATQSSPRIREAQWVLPEERGSQWCQSSSEFVGKQRSP